ncbi:MAG: hypothetical protein IKO14_08070 [Oscillibacter sp.]|nr:hypothetical protein [Oscillibacter sp.]
MLYNRLKIPSRFLRNPAEMILLAPETNAPEKSLVFFHGAGESGQAILDNSPLADIAEAQNLRIALPFVGNSFGLNCGEGEQVRAFLTEELFPYLRDVLFVPPGAVCVGGISMGACVALSAGLEQRDFVSGVFSISGAFDLRKAARFGRVCGLEIPSAVAETESRPSEWTRHLLERYAGRGAPSLYFACGDGDLFRDVNRATALRAMELGYSVRWQETPGLHNWDYWREALPPALQWAAMTGGVYGD